MSQSFVGAVEHQCDGKRTYLNSTTAKRAAKHTMATQGGGKMVTQGGGKMVTYRCPHCGRFHNGHPPYSVKKRRRV